MWDPHTKYAHGKNEAIHEIIDADDMGTAWKKILEFINGNVDASKTAIIVVYNGETCGLKWFWRLTQDLNSPLFMLPQIKSFLGHLHVMR